MDRSIGRQERRRRRELLGLSARDVDESSGARDDYCGGAAVRRRDP